MALLPPFSPSDSHWYRVDGSPCHSLPRADGKTRPTTLADAKTLRLLPSVTSILSIFSKPQLDIWKQRQVALAAERVERCDGELDDTYADRVMAAAFRQVAEAADLGSRIHAALESYYVGVPYPEDLAPYVAPVVKWKQEKQLIFAQREKVVVNLAHGFAGTMDVAVRFGDGIGVLDFKTRKTKPGMPIIPYDGQAMQIAAYAATFWGEESLARVYGGNVFISTTEPGRMEVFTYRPEQLVVEWETFRMACAIWRHLRNYDPRQPMSRPPQADAA
jgi:hypothetical protein